MTWEDNESSHCLDRQYRLPGDLAGYKYPCVGLEDPDVGAADAVAHIENVLGSSDKHCHRRRT